MSKHKKSAKKQAKSLGDVTINDFANSAVCKNRLKKSNSNINTIIKQLEVDKDKPWDEKDYEDLDYVEEENEDGTLSLVLKKVEDTKEICSLKKENKPGRDYPLDIWFLISEYIKPEDVGIFSCICKTSYAVTHTAKFWFSLYKHYYKSVPNLPERLQPECMLRLYGVRTSVIRALFHMYPLFINRFKTIKTEEHPDVLTRRQCALMWHRENKSQWVYYFKLKEITNLCLAHRSKPTKKPDLIEMLDNVAANNEENCRILQITCTNFIPVAPVQGLFLTSVGVTLSQGFRHNRVQLGFSSGLGYSKQSIDGSSCIGILLDPVVNVKILDWWHPLYPHSYNVEFLLNQE